MNRHFCETVPTLLWSTTVVRTETMKDDKIVLIAHHMLKSSISTYIEWLVNELMMTAKKLNIRTHI